MLTIHSFHLITPEAVDAFLCYVWQQNQLSGGQRRLWETIKGMSDCYNHTVDRMINGEKVKFVFSCF